MVDDTLKIENVNYGKIVKDRIFTAVLAQLINKIPRQSGNFDAHFMASEAMKITEIAMNEMEV